MPKILSFVNQKGGVGKTTLCLQMAFWLSSIQKKVLVIDLDPQGNTSSRLLPNPSTGSKTIDLFRTNSPVQPQRCNHGMYIIYSDKHDAELADLESYKLSEVMAINPNLQEVMQEYDYVLIDCAPSLGRKLIAALSISTHVVCPIELSMVSLDGVEGLLKTIFGVQRSINEDLKFVGLAVNKKERSLHDDRLLVKLKEMVPNFVLDSILMQRSPINQATSEGVPIASLGFAHVAAKEMEAMLQEIILKIE